MQFQRPHVSKHRQFQVVDIRNLQPKVFHIDPSSLGSEHFTSAFHSAILRINNTPVATAKSYDTARDTILMTRKISNANSKTFPC